MTETKYDTEVAVGLILNPSDEILLQKKDRGYPWNPGMWCFFGGHFKEGESGLETFGREMKEELGITLEDIALFKNFPFSDTQWNGKRRGGIIHTYSALFTGNINEIRLGEGGGFAFFHRDEIQTTPIVSHNKDIIEIYYQNLDRIRTNF